jgi:DNA polymerase epsilon subunit 2
MICSYPTLKDESKFLFVPGPSDPGSPTIYPRAPLPTHLTQDLKVVFKKFNFDLDILILTILTMTCLNTFMRYQTLYYYRN